VFHQALLLTALEGKGIKGRGIKGKGMKEEE
jgi:hypothetical protein